MEINIRKEREGEKDNLIRKGEKENDETDRSDRNVIRTKNGDKVR